MSDFSSGRTTETLNLDVVKMGGFIQLVSMVFQQRMEKYRRPVDKRDEVPTMERPMLGIGKPGIGKTEILRSLLVNKFDLPREAVVELRLGSMQDTDIIGIPTISHKDGYDVTKFASLETLPRKGTHPEFGILVLDEITTCDSGVRTVALQLLDSSRSVGDYTLPDGWMIVALGNGPEDGADYEELKSTIISRCAGYYIEIDFPTWYEWASQNGIHDAVLGFLRQGMGQDLFNTDGRKDYDAQIATPRTWQITSDMLKVCEATSPGGVIPEDLVQPICCSGVGAHMGAKFKMFYIHKRSLIPLEQIVDGSAIKNYNKTELVLEAMYLGQNAIVRYMLGIGEKNKALYEVYYKKWVQLTTQTNWDETPDQDVLELTNIMRFIIWYSEVNLPWALSTLEALTKTSSFTKNKLYTYFCIDNSKFRKMCPEFAQFVEKNAILTQAMSF